MNLAKAVKILDALAEVVSPIPTAGPGLVIMLKVASQVCAAAEVRTRLCRTSANLADAIIGR